MENEEDLDIGAIDRFYQRRDRESLSSSAFTLDERSPDEFGQERQIAEDAGVEPLEVAANPEVHARTALTNRVERLTQIAPFLRTWLQNPDNLGVAQDDVETLASIERAAREDEASRAVLHGLQGATRNVRAPGLEQTAYDVMTAPVRALAAPFTDAPRMYAQGQMDTELGLLERQAMLATQGRAPVLTPEAEARRQELINRPGRDDWGPFVLGPVVRMAPQIMTSLERGARQAGEGAAGPFRGFDPGRFESWAATPFASVAAGFGAVGGFASGYLGTTFDLEAGGAYGEMVRQGVAPEIAAERAEQYGAWSVALEFAGDALLLPFSGALSLGRKALGLDGRVLTGGLRAAVERFAGNFARSAASEGAEEASQELAQIIHTELAQQETRGEKEDLLQAWRASLTPEHIQQILFAGYIGAQGGIGFAAVPSSINLGLEVRELEGAAASARVFEQQTQAAQASLVGQRHAGSLESAATQMDPSDVFIDADEFAQHFQSLGQDPFRAAEDLRSGGSDALAQALAAHGRLTVPSGTFVARVLRDPAHARLQEHASRTIDGETPARASVRMEVMRAEFEKIAEEARNAQDGEALADFVHDRVRAELDQAAREGAMNPSLTRLQPQLYRAMAKALLAFGETGSFAGEEARASFAKRTDAFLRGLFTNRFDVMGPARAEASVAPSEARARIEAMVAEEEEADAVELSSHLLAQSGIDDSAPGDPRARFLISDKGEVQIANDTGRTFEDEQLAQQMRAFVKEFAGFGEPREIARRFLEDAGGDRTAAEIALAEQIEWLKERPTSRSKTSRYYEARQREIKDHERALELLRHPALKAVEGSRPPTRAGEPGELAQSEMDDGAPSDARSSYRGAGRREPPAQIPEPGSPEWDAAVKDARAAQQKGQRLTPVQRALLRWDKEGGELAQLGGIGAHTADAASFERAAEMEEQGADEGTIWRETGWWRDPGDRMWRFEIDDSNAALAPAFLMRGAFDGKLADLLVFPELYAAYPSLADIDVKALVDPNEARAGGFVEGEAVIGFIAQSAEDAMSILMHEVQHAIQAIENFARGGSPAQAKGFVFEFLAARERARQDVVLNYFGGDEAAFEAERHSGSSRARAIDAAIEEDAAKEVYYRFAGEIEARNVQRRRGDQTRGTPARRLSPQERKTTPPGETVDTDLSEAVVHFGTGTRYVAIRSIAEEPGSAVGEVLGDPPGGAKGLGGDRSAGYGRAGGGAQGGGASVEPGSGGSAGEARGVRGGAGRSDLDPLGFRSVALEAAAALPSRAMRGEEAVNRILKARGVEGFTGRVADEVDYLGLREEFGARKSVSKEEILDYIRINRLVLEEAFNRFDPKEARRAPNLTEWTAEKDHVNAFGEDVWVVDRGLYGRVPMNAPTAEEAIRRVAAELEAIPAARMDAVASGIRRGPGDLRLPGDEPVFELRIKIPEGLPGSDFESHWSRPPTNDKGVLVSIRGEERLDDQGKRTLFGGEVQSDLAQKARADKEIVVQRERRARWAEEALAENPDAAWFTQTTDGPYKPLENGNISREMLTDFGQHDRSVADSLRGATVDAPLASKTSAWTGAAVRALVYRAARDGFDSVSFPTGETSALIQGNDSAAAHYDTNVKGAAQKIARAFGVELREGHVEYDIKESIDRVDVGIRRALETYRADPAAFPNFDPARAERQLAESVANAEATRTKTASAYVLPIIPEMRARILKEGMPLFQQQSQEGRRGSILPKLTEDGDVQAATIRLFEASDLSTFLHESGHLFRYILGTVARDPDAPAELQKMWSDTLSWFGVTEAEWDALDFEGKRPLEEQWAETFEAYLMEGRAPSLSLREAFATFKAWLIQIYRSVFARGLGNAKLTPEIRDVFARLLATEQEMAEARAAAGVDRGMFANAKEAGMSEEAFAEYQSAIQGAREAQDAELRARVMETYTRQQKRWWRSERARIRLTVEREIDADPARRALDWLAFGEWRELPVETDEEGAVTPATPSETEMTERPEGLPEMSLSPEALAEDYGEGIFAELPKALRPARPEDVEQVLSEAMALKKGGKTKRPQRLAAFVRALGGVKDEGGEIVQALGNAKNRPGLINNKTGRSLDDIALAAYEAGYFGRVAPRQASLFQGEDPLSRAQSEGYNGTDTGEAIEWLRAKAKGLPMDEASRMARAREMGFDVETPLYHGTGADIAEFRRSPGLDGDGVYLTTDPESASRYARNATKGAISGQNVIPVFARGAHSVDGYKSIRVVSDPRNIRSRFAAFDPDYSESANLLAQDEPTERPTPREFLDALIADLRNERAVYSIRDSNAVAENAERESALRWFESRGIDLSKNKEDLRADIAAALEKEAGREDAVSPDDAAPWFGFKDGASLIAALKALKPRAQAIEDGIKAKLDAEYGDIFRDGTIADAARQAANVEAQARVLEIELAAIERAAGGRVTPVNRAAKQFAEQAVARMSMKELRGHERFLAGERRAARNAFDALAKGDHAEAARQKMRQISSLYLHRLAREASEQVEKYQRHWDHLTTNASARKAIGQQHIERIDAIINRVRAGSGRGPLGLTEWANALKEEGAEDLLTFDPALIEERMQRPFASLSYEEVQAVNDVIRNIEAIGRGMVKFRAAQEAQRISDIQTGLKERIQAEWSEKLARRLSLVAPNAKDKVATEIQNISGLLLKLDFLARRLDGFKDGGPWMALMAQAQHAQNALTDREIAAAREFQAIVKAHYSDKQFRQMLSQRLHLPALDDTRTKAQLIGYALNMGTEYNRDALLRGEGWNESTLQAVLDPLDKNDWAFVQALWNYIGQWKEESFALDERTRGVRPKEELAVPIATKHGTFAGGYWPVSFDSKRSDQAAAREARNTIIGEYGAGFRQAATNRGRLIGRSGTGGQALSDDWLSILATHTRDSLRDLTHRDLVITLRRVKSDKGLRDMIARVAGRNAMKALDEWVFRLAARTPQKVFGDYDRLPAYLRRAGTNHAMGFKLSVSALNLLGHFQAIPRNGVMAQMKQAGITIVPGFADLLRRHLIGFATGDKPVAARVQFVYDRSSMMRLRAQQFDRDISDIKGDIVGRREGSVLPKAFEDTLQMLNIYTDKIVTIPTWLAAYESALDGKVKGVEGEEAAIDYADSVVRGSIGAGAPKDLAALMAANNQWQRLMTMFMGWASTFWNQMAEEQIPGVMSGKIPIAKFAANMAWIWLLPAVISMVFYGQTDQRDDEDDDAYWRRMAATGLIYPLQTVPIVRDAMSAWVQGYKAQTPLSSVIDRGTKLLSALDRENERQIVKQGFLLAGQLFGIPSQFYTTGDYVIDLAQGEEDPLADPVDAVEEALLRDTR